MTDNQKQAIDRMDETQLTKQISVLSTSNTDGRDKLMAYCDHRLTRLNRSEAMVVKSEVE